MATKPKTKKKPAKQAPKAGRGRPTTYKPEFVKMVYQLALLGQTDAEMAAVLQVTEQTFNNWKNAHPEFFESLNEGKALADARVADRLYQRAMGFEHDSEEIKVLSDPSFGSYVERVKVRKIYPPDTAAAIFWLKNRQSRKWREKVETGITDSDGNDIPMAVMAPTGVLTFKTVQPNAGSTDTK